MISGGSSGGSGRTQTDANTVVDNRPYAQPAGSSEFLAAMAAMMDNTEPVDRSQDVQVADASATRSKYPGQWVNSTLNGLPIQTRDTGPGMWDERAVPDQPQQAETQRVEITGRRMTPDQVAAYDAAATSNTGFFGGLSLAGNVLIDGLNNYLERNRADTSGFFLPDSPVGNTPPSGGESVQWGSAAWGGLMGVANAGFAMPQYEPNNPSAALGMQAVGAGLTALTLVGAVAPFMGPLEVNALGPNSLRTVEAYQVALDDAAAALYAKRDAGAISPTAGLNTRTWEGNLIDRYARDDMLTFKQINGMADLRVNQRLSTDGGIKDYRIPDLFVPGERTVIDGTIGFKDVNTPQVQDFFHSGQADTVVIQSPGKPWKIITVNDYFLSLKPR